MKRHPGLCLFALLLACLTAAAVQVRLPFRQRQSGLPLQLISYWKLDETSGIRYDSRGTNHLAVTGSVSSTNGVVGNAAYFDCDDGMGSPINNALSVADNAQLSPTLLDWSFTGWFRSEDDPSFVSIQPLQKNLGGTTNSEYWLDVDASTPTFHTFYQVSPPTGCSTSSDATVGAGAWIFFCLTHYAGDNTLTLYIHSAGGSATNSTVCAGPPLDTVAPLVFGYNNAVGADPYRLRMDEVAFFHRLLSAAEALWFFNEGAGRTYNPVTQRFEPP